METKKTNIVPFSTAEYSSYNAEAEKKKMSLGSVLPKLLMIAVSARKHSAKF